MSNWLANLQSVSEDSGTSLARITWHNDVEGKKSQQDVPLIGIKDIVAFNSILRNTRDNKLDTSVELVKILSSEIGTDLDIEAPLPTPPDPKEIAKNEWVDKYRKLLGAQRQIASGVFKDTDPDYTTLLKDVINTYITPDYLGLS